VSELPRVLELRTISGKGGGPEKTLLNSPRFLRGVYDVRLAYLHPTGDLDFDMPERARRLDVDLVAIAEKGPADPRALWRLIQVIRDYRPAILHAHDYKTDLLAVLLGRCFRIPVMTTMHGFVTRGGRLEAYYRLSHWALKRMDHVVAVSADLYQQLIDLKVPPARRSLIENGIDTEQFARRRPAEEARGRLGLNPRRLTVGAVGRLMPEKGFELLIRAADELLRAGLDLDLLLVGDGDEKPRLQALITELGRGDRIRLLGYRSDLVELYEAMDVFALSSLREGLPNVLLEALALEVPAVATHVGGVPRLIRHEENGLLVEPGSVGPLRDALARLLGDAGLRACLGRAGRQTVEGRYSFALRMQKMRAVYDGLLARCKQAAARRVGAHA
jgi:glycosyltransferase involved in cell wall biosynthesis